jgi:hypothetical protein
MRTASSPSAHLTTAEPSARRLRRIARHPWFILSLLAGQFVLWSLLTVPLYGDSPRNLHWGLLTAENPGFLTGDVDPYERIKGFAPDPPELAPRGLYRNEYSSLHRWWGPVMPLAIAGLWRVTGSYTLIQLVIPLVGGAAVLTTYALARRYLPIGGALLAAGFLAFFPLFRDYASTAYSEALSAFVLTAALLSYRSGRTLLTVVLGTLALLAKLDLVLLYGGVVGVCVLVAWFTRDTTLPWRHHGAALLIPPLLAAPWIWVHYLNAGAGGPTAGLSLPLFGIIAPQMLELLFYVPWYGALLVLGLLGAGVFLGARSLAGCRLDLALLLSWLGLGVLVTLVYAATPGAGNSPRIVIPALPPLAILFALGFRRFTTAWRRRTALFIGGMFLLINVVSIGYYAVEGAELRSYRQAWSYLREQPQGFVLTEQYWATLLYTRQPVTWFEQDPAFERAIMHDATAFERYVTTHPIRYVILPREGDLAAPAVRAYLDATARATPAGAHTVYTLPSTP